MAKVQKNRGKVFTGNPNNTKQSKVRPNSKAKGKKVNYCLIGGPLHDVIHPLTTPSTMTLEIGGLKGHYELEPVEGVVYPQSKMTGATYPFIYWAACE